MRMTIKGRMASSIDKIPSISILFADDIEYTFLYFIVYTITESHEYQHSQQKRE
jgi:hypothetical protein